jgi:Rrf2 family protein
MINIVNYSFGLSPAIWPLIDASDAIGDRPERKRQIPNVLSQRGRYALKALTYLARAGNKPGQVIAIAEAENIPRKFLEAIMSDLRRANLVASLRGKFGGYILARAAEDIMFGDIIRATDGPLALVPCASKAFYRRCDDCTDEATCAIRKVMADVRDEVSAILDRTSLAQAAAIGQEQDAPST